MSRQFDQNQKFQNPRPREKEREPEKPESKRGSGIGYGTVNLNNIRNTFNFNIILDPSALKGEEREELRNKFGVCKREKEVANRAKTVVVRKRDASQESQKKQQISRSYVPTQREEYGQLIPLTALQALENIRQKKMNTTFENFSGGSSLLSYNTQKGIKAIRRETEGRKNRESLLEPDSVKEPRFSEEVGLSGFRIQSGRVREALGYSSHQNISKRGKVANQIRHQDEYGIHTANQLNHPNTLLSKNTEKSQQEARLKEGYSRKLSKEGSIGTSSRFATPLGFKEKATRERKVNAISKTTGQKWANQVGPSFSRIVTSRKKNSLNEDSKRERVIRREIRNNRGNMGSQEKKYSKSQIKSARVVDEGIKRLRKGGKRNGGFSSEHTGKRGLVKKYIKRTGSIDEFICLDLKVRVRRKKRENREESLKVYRSTFKEARDGKATPSVQTRVSIPKVIRSTQSVKKPLNQNKNKFLYPNQTAATTPNFNHNQSEPPKNRSTFTHTQIDTRKKFSFGGVETNNSVIIPKSPKTTAPRVELDLERKVIRKRLIKKEYKGDSLLEGNTSEDLIERNRTSNWRRESQLISDSMMVARPRIISKKLRYSCQKDLGSIKKRKEGLSKTQTGFAREKEFARTMGGLGGNKNLRDFSKKKDEGVWGEMTESIVLGEVNGEYGLVKDQPKTYKINRLNKFRSELGNIGMSPSGLKVSMEGTSGLVESKIVGDAKFMGESGVTRRMYSSQVRMGGSKIDSSGLVGYLKDKYGSVSVKRKEDSDKSSYTSITRSYINGLKVVRKTIKGPLVKRDSILSRPISKSRETIDNIKPKDSLQKKEEVEPAESNGEILTTVKKTQTQKDVKVENTQRQQSNLDSLIKKIGAAIDNFEGKTDNNDNENIEESNLLQEKNIFYQSDSQNQSKDVNQIEKSPKRDEYGYTEHRQTAKFLENLIDPNSSQFKEETKGTEEPNKKSETNSNVTEEDLKDQAKKRLIQFKDKMYINFKTRGEELRQKLEETIPVQRVDTLQTMLAKSTTREDIQQADEVSSFSKATKLALSQPAKKTFFNQTNPSELTESNKESEVKEDLPSEYQIYNQSDTYETDYLGSGADSHGFVRLETNNSSGMFLFGEESSKWEVGQDNLEIGDEFLKFRVNSRSEENLQSGGMTMRVVSQNRSSADGQLKRSKEYDIQGNVFKREEKNPEEIMIEIGDEREESIQNNNLENEDIEEPKLYESQNEIEKLENEEIKVDSENLNVMEDSTEKENMEQKQEEIEQNSEIEKSIEEETKQESLIEEIENENEIIADEELKAKEGSQETLECKEEIEEIKNEMEKIAETSIPQIIQIETAKEDNLSEVIEQLSEEEENISQIKEEGETGLSEKKEKSESIQQENEDENQPSQIEEKDQQIEKEESEDLEIESQKSETDKEEQETEVDKELVNIEEVSKLKIEETETLEKKISVESLNQLDDVIENYLEDLVASYHSEMEQETPNQKEIHQTQNYIIDNQTLETENLEQSQKIEESPENISNIEEENESFQDQSKLEETEKSENQNDEITRQSEEFGQIINEEEMALIDMKGEDGEIEKDSRIQTESENIENEKDYDDFAKEETESVQNLENQNIETDEPSVNQESENIEEAENLDLEKEEETIIPKEEIETSNNQSEMRILDLGLISFKTPHGFQFFGEFDNTTQTSRGVILAEETNSLRYIGEMIDFTPEGSGLLLGPQITSIMNEIQNSESEHLLSIQQLESKWKLLYEEDENNSQISEDETESLITSEDLVKLYQKMTKNILNKVVKGYSNIMIKENLESIKIEEEQIKEGIRKDNQIEEDKMSIESQEFETITISKEFIENQISEIDPSKAIRCQGNFKNGLLCGQGIKYYQNGMKITGNFEQGIPIGDCIVEVFDQKIDFLVRVFGEEEKFDFENLDLEIFGEEESIQWKGSGEEGFGLSLMLKFTEQGLDLIF